MIYQNERPVTFDEMKGQTYVVENIRNQSKRNTWFQQYILGGQFGSGKTTMARIILRAANCEHKDENGNPCGTCKSCKAITSGIGDFKEIDGASNTGVDNIRELQEFISFRPAILKKKVIIIDEVHKLSVAAFNSLLKILEEPPHYVIFILCTTDVDAIPQTVQSRCAVYRFGPIDEEVIKNHVLNVAEKNSIAITEDAAYIIARNSQGAMRNALKLLEQLSSAGTEITADICKETLGISDEEMVFDFLRAFLKSDVSSLIRLVDEVGAKGKDYLMLSKDLVAALSDLVVVSCASEKSLKGNTLYVEEAGKLSKEFSLRSFCSLSSELVQLVRAVKQEGTRNNFLIQSIALMERVRESDVSMVKRLDDMEEKLCKVMEQGIVVSTQKEVEASEDVTVSDSVPEYTEKEPVTDEVGQGYEDDGFFVSYDPVPFDDFVQNQDYVTEPFRAEESGCEEKEVTTPVAEPMAEPTEESVMEEVVVEEPAAKLNGLGLEDLEEFDDFFDEDEMEDSFQEQRPVAVKSAVTADAKDVASAPVLSKRAEKALRELEGLAERDPEIAVHLKVGCKKTFHEHGIILSTPENMVATCLTLFLAKYNMTDVRVEYDPNVKIA